MLSYQALHAEPAAAIAAVACHIKDGEARGNLTEDDVTAHVASVPRLSSPGQWFREHQLSDVNILKMSFQAVFVRG
jgi:hypothetical protein